MLYALNLYSDIYQLFLNKTGQKREKINDKIASLRKQLLRSCSWNFSEFCL